MTRVKTNTTAAGAAAGSTDLELHVALVTGKDGIRLAVIEKSDDGMLRRLSDYVREEAPNALWPKDASQVSALLSAGRWETAIDFYFARVGNRWDQEFLHREIVPYHAGENVRRNSSASSARSRDRP